jgi:GAF domain-containing protein
MQPAYDEKLMQRLIQSLSELEQLGEAIISGQSNFGVSGKIYLQVILKTLQITKGAILRFDSIENQLVVESSINIKKKSVVIPISSHEIAIIRQSPILDLSQPPVSLKPFFDEIQPQLQALDATLWAALKIGEQFLGIISLSSDVEMEKWERKLLNVLASHTSIVIAHSRLIEEMRAAKFRLFLLSDMTAQISKQLDTESLEEEVMSYAISLLDASA